MTGIANTEYWLLIGPSISILSSDWCRRVNTTICDPDDWMEIARPRWHPHKAINPALIRYWASFHRYSGAATPVWQVSQLPYLGLQIFQKQMTQWAKSGDIGAKNGKNWSKNLSNGQKKQVFLPLPSLPKWGNAAPAYKSLCPRRTQKDPEGHSSKNSLYL